MNSDARVYLADQLAHIRDGLLLRNQIPAVKIAISRRNLIPKSTSRT